MSARPRYPRSTCCIVGCGRWSTLFPGEWMCRDHWMSLSKDLRRLLKRSWRRHAAAWDLYQASQTKRPWQSERRTWAASERLWIRAKRIATEKAAGV